MPPDQIAILDFGGQYAHLITNRIRRLGVHAIIVPHDSPAEHLKDFKGIILSGGPQSVNAEKAILADPKLFELGIPVLGICYGHQLTNKLLGGKISPGKTKEYGKTKLYIDHAKGIFEGLEGELKKTSPFKGQGVELTVWMSHWDEVTEMPSSFEVLAHTDINDFAAVGNLEKHIYGIQFHPEVTHTEHGMKMLENFVNITGAEKSWESKNYIKSIEEDIITQVTESGRKVFMLVSGGVDSVVAFALLNNVLGQNKVYGLLVDTGFMRKGEIDEVQQAIRGLGFTNLHVVDAKDTFYSNLTCIHDPEEKREIIGRTFIEIQKKAVQEMNLDPKHWMLGQGTIYPDTIESGATEKADKIKTHHNRVPEIDELIKKGLVIEPLKDLYKDEVRELGEQLGLPHHLVWRHPFPGPGLAIRMLCTPPVLNNGRDGTESDLILAKEYLKEKGLAGCILPLKSVGVQGDARSYRHPMAIWPEEGSWEDHWEKEKLQEISTELTNRFGSINRVIFSLSENPIKNCQLLLNKLLTPNRVTILQESDAIVMNEINSFDLEEKLIWQCPTVLLPIGINESESESVLIRPVSSIDAMTADFALIPIERLNNILEHMKLLKPSGIFYDLTNKPPGTIEWE